MSRSARRNRGVATFAALAWLGAAALGCHGGEARAPNPTRVLDERRAVEVIRQTMLREGVQPAPGRDVTLGSDRTLHVDVGVAGHAYGVAYVTVEDVESLGGAIPPRNQKDERLRLVRANDGESRFVVLYQENYVYDDLVGEAHSQTTIASESQLARDVSDFLHHARSQGYK
jgi:hypothetical protein